MKRLFPITLALLSASLACNISLPNTISGSGNIVTESYKVDGFNQVELNTTGEVRVEQGGSEGLSIETDDNIVSLLDVKVEEGKLTLGVKNDVNIKPSREIIYHLVVKALTSLTTNSSGDFYAGNIEANKLELSVNGSGSVILNDVKAEDFSITSNGSGNVRVDHVETDIIHAIIGASGGIQLAGNATSLRIESSGSGDMLAGELQTSTAEIDVQASGDVIAWVSDSLAVTISGSGRVEYYGTPGVSQYLTGSGTLKSLGDT